MPTAIRDPKYDRIAGPVLDMATTEEADRLLALLDEANAIITQVKERVGKNGWRAYVTIMSTRDDRV